MDYTQKNHPFHPFPQPYILKNKNKTKNWQKNTTAIERKTASNIRCLVLKAIFFICSCSFMSWRFSRGWRYVMLRKNISNMAGWSWISSSTEVFSLISRWFVYRGVLKNANSINLTQYSMPSRLDGDSNRLYQKASFYFITIWRCLA